MDWLRGMLARLRATLRRGAAEREMEEELRFHLEMEVAKNLRAGMSAEEAERRARVAFGASERYREELRDGRRVGWLEDLARDVRFAVRALARSPGFALVAVLTVALGVGATTAVFSVANALLLRPLPAWEPERLFVVQEQRTGAMSSGAEGVRLPYGRVQAYREATASVFAGLAAQRYESMSLRTQGEAEAVNGVLASGDYFAVLGLRPAAGRFFAADREPAGPHHLCGGPAGTGGGDLAGQLSPRAAGAARGPRGGPASRVGGGPSPIRAPAPPAPAGGPRWPG